ncbi:MAG: hypothetical protein FD129_1069, partial [bacterium]
MIRRVALLALAGIFLCVPPSRGADPSPTPASRPPSDVDRILARGVDGFSLSAAPGRWSMFNRVEGARVGFGLDARITRGLRFQGDGGYAFAAHRWVGQAALSVGRRRTGPMLRLSAVDRMETFGPN